MKAAWSGMGRAPRPAARRGSAGFTLVEVLVALLVMAILAGLAWQALDSVMRARDDSPGAGGPHGAPGHGADAMGARPASGARHRGRAALAFDGQTLRLTRRAEGGVQLVAWAVRNNQWQRWAGPTLVSTGELQEAWLRSQQLLGTEPGTVMLAEDASQWQVYFARGGQWSNAQSSGDLVVTSGPPRLGFIPPPEPPASGASAAAPQTVTAPQVLREALPEAVRLQVTLGGQVLTRDIALGPAGS